MATKIKVFGKAQNRTALGAYNFTESFNRNFENSKPKGLDLSHMRKRGEGYEL
ncbi:MAG: hypothetical protein R3Y04_00135 [Rikenellaceae bacterium]